MVCFYRQSGLTLALGGEDGIIRLHDLSSAEGFKSPPVNQELNILSLPGQVWWIINTTVRGYIQANIKWICWNIIPGNWILVYQSLCCLQNVVFTTSQIQSKESEEHKFSKWILLYQLFLKIHFSGNAFN